MNDKSPGNSEERAIWWGAYCSAREAGQGSWSDHADIRLAEYRAMFPATHPDTSSADRLAHIGVEIQAWEADPNRNSTRTLDRIAEILGEKS